MVKKSLQIVFFVLALAVVAVLQFALVFASPLPFKALNLPLLVLIFSLFFYDLRLAVVGALIIGLWMDFISFNFFGFYILTLLLTVGLAFLILQRWLTNRSLYSFLLLLGLAAFAYQFAGGALYYFFALERSQFFLFSSDFWLMVAWQSAWSAGAGLLMFNLASAATKRLKPFFLEKG